MNIHVPGRFATSPDLYTRDHLFKQCVHHAEQIDDQKGTQTPRHSSFTPWKDVPMQCLK